MGIDEFLAEAKARAGRLARYAHEAKLTNEPRVTLSFETAGEVYASQLSLVAIVEAQRAELDHMSHVLAKTHTTTRWPIGNAAIAKRFEAGDFGEVGK